MYSIEKVCWASYLVSSAQTRFSLPLKVKPILLNVKSVLFATAEVSQAPITNGRWAHETPS